MPGRIGPLLTTGVALSVAAVVVANPVIVPRADLQIPSVMVKLSSTGDAMDMLNADFLEAIGPTPAESSNNPFVVLRDLIASLAADATYLGRNAIVGAFFAGASAVTNPELTAASHPYVPPASQPPVPIGPVPIGPVPVGPVPVGPVDWPAHASVSTDELLAIAAIPADLVPASAEVVMALMDDVRGLGDTAVSAAFAAGALLVTGGAQVIDAVHGLVGGDVAALNGVLAAVGSGEPQKAILNAIHIVVDEPASVPRSFVAPPVASPSADAQDSADPGLLVTPSPRAEPVAVEQVPRRTPVERAPVILPRPDAEDVNDEPALPDDLDDAAAAAIPGAGAVRPDRKPVRPGPVHNAATDIGKRVQGILRGAADTVNKAADRAARAAAGPTGD